MRSPISLRRLGADALYAVRQQSASADRVRLGQQVVRPARSWSAARGFAEDLFDRAREAGACSTSEIELASSGAARVEPRADGSAAGPGHALLSPRPRLGLGDRIYGIQEQSEKRLLRQHRRARAGRCQSAASRTSAQRARATRPHGGAQQHCRDRQRATG